MIPTIELDSRLFLKIRLTVHLTTVLLSPIGPSDPEEHVNPLSSPRKNVMDCPPKFLRRRPINGDGAGSLSRLRNSDALRTGEDRWNCRRDSDPTTTGRVGCPAMLGLLNCQRGVRDCRFFCSFLTGIVPICSPIFPTTGGYPWSLPASRKMPWLASPTRNFADAPSPG